MSHVHQFILVVDQNTSTAVMRCDDCGEERPVDVVVPEETDSQETDSAEDDDFGVLCW
jgi:hypothetical protein